MAGPPLHLPRCSSSQSIPSSASLRETEVAQLKDQLRVYKQEVSDGSHLENN